MVVRPDMWLRRNNAMQRKAHRAAADAERHVGLGSGSGIAAHNSNAEGIKDLDTPPSAPRRNVAVARYPNPEGSGHAWSGKLATLAWANGQCSQRRHRLSSLIEEGENRHAKV
jgi:hypothetical protein